MLQDDSEAATAAHDDSFTLGEEIIGLGFVIVGLYCGSRCMVSGLVGLFTVFKVEGVILIVTVS